MKKALIIANAASMIHLFNEINIDILQAAGFEVHIACNFVYGNTISPQSVEKCVKNWEAKSLVLHQIGFLRSPFSIQSFQIYRETKRLIQGGDFDIIHCHTPIVSVFTRLAARRLRKTGTKVAYTAHGFHFYDGCKKINWLTFYVVEKLLAPLTDVLITINKEDYERAKRKFNAKHIYYVNGIGIDVEKIKNTKVDVKEKRREIGVSEDDILLISVGELSARKNHEAAIKALARCRNKDKMQYIIAGIGGLNDYLKDLAQRLGVSDRVHLLGFREDIYELLKASDIFVFPSYSEGLPVALMEAMAAGLPAVASVIRGNVDLIDGSSGGFLCKPYKVKELAELIDTLAENKTERESMGAYNIEKVKLCDEKRIIAKLTAILNTMCVEDEKSGRIEGITPPYQLAKDKL